MEYKIEKFISELVEVTEVEGTTERIKGEGSEYGNFTKDSFIGALECLFGGEHDERIEDSLGLCNPYLMSSYMARLIVANELTECEPSKLLNAIVDKMAEFGVDVSEALQTKCRASLAEVAKLQKYNKRLAYKNAFFDRERLGLH